MSKSRPVASPLEGEGERRGGKGLVAAAILISTLQGVLFALLGSRQHLLVAAVALASVVTCWFLLRNRRRYRMAIILTLLAVQLVIFWYHLVFSPTPFRYRLLHLTLALCYVTPLLALALWRLRLLPVRRSFLLAGSMGLSLLLGEVLIDLVEKRGHEARLRGTGAPWIADINPHPRLGYYHARGGSARSYYPDNPRGYFKEVDPASRLWTLSRRGKRGRLEFSGEPDFVRVADLAGELEWQTNGFRPPPWHVRLNQQSLAGGIDAGRYVLRFRGRADRSRQITSTVMQTHEPWQSVGLHQTVELSPSWQAFAHEFTVAERDPGARIEFRLGADQWPVEITEVVLVRLPGGERLEATLQHPFFVSYSFNQLGCRGPDYPIPRPPDRRRLLALGDSFTLGLGVHESDTFTSQLENLLSERASQRGSRQRYEVINCGVSGYATRQERLQYELISSRYEAEIVVVAMHRNDVRSYLEDREKGYVQRRLGRWEFLLLSWNRIQRIRHRPPPPDYSPMVEDLKLLDQACRADDARLVVVIFRSSREPGWTKLVTEVTEGLDRTDIPLLDLGPAVLRDHQDLELWVHLSDAHPNEIAHRLAAEEIARFLEEEGLLDG